MRKQNIIETISGYENNGFEQNLKTYKEVWDKNPQSAGTIFTKQQIIDLGMSNNIPELSRKYKKRFDLFVIFIWSCIAIGTMLWTWLIIHLIQKAL